MFIFFDSNCTSKSVQNFRNIWYRQRNFKYSNSEENRRSRALHAHHCSFVCCLFLSIWLPDSSHTCYTAFAPSELYQCFTPFSGACRTCEVTLLCLDIVEYHFSWLKENLSLSCHFAGRFPVMPTSPLLSDLSGKFLGSKNENVNHKELYWVLTNKTFLPSLHGNKDNSNPIKARWGKRETELLLPIALFFLGFGLHCSSPAMSPPGRPVYELPPNSVLCFTFLIIYMQYCYQVIHSKGNMMV